MTETIVAAALLRNGQIYSLPPPARHGDIIRKFSMTSVDDTAGFLTSTGRFVDRDAAYTIARDAQQIKCAAETGTLVTGYLW